MPLPQPSFDQLQVEQEVDQNPGWHHHLADPANCPIRVESLVELLNGFRTDLRSYSSTHGIDSDLRHVCLCQPCLSDHVGCTHVSHSEARGEVRPLDPNMHLVVNRYIKPWTLPCHVSYAGALLTLHHLTVEKGSSESSFALLQRFGVVPSTLRRPHKRRAATHAHIFVSHNWAERFEDFVATAQSVASYDTYLWVCAFAINQNASIGDALKCDSLADCAFARALKFVNHVVVFMDGKAITLTRVWCILEAHFALGAERTYSIAVPDSSDVGVWSAVRAKCADLDVRNAEASVAADRDRIMMFVKGSEDLINTEVRRLAVRSCDDAATLRAARLGDAEALEGMQRPFCEDAGKSTTLHHAATASTKGAVVQLLRLRADPKSRNVREETPLHWAALSPSGTTIAPLVSARAGLEVRDTEGKTPLHVATTAGSLESAHWLLRSAADMEAKSWMGLTPLHMAAKGGHLPVVGLLVEARARLDQHTRESEPDGIQATFIGGTALHTAAHAGHEAVVRELAKSRSNIGAGLQRGIGPGATPLMSAATNGHVACVELLVKVQADPNAGLTGAMFRGLRPLHYATMRGHAGVLHALLQGRAELDGVGTSWLFRGLHAMHLAAFKGHCEAMEVLLAARAAPDPKVKGFFLRGCQPLHLAALNGTVESVKMLLEGRADVNAKVTAWLLNNVNSVLISSAAADTTREEVVRELLASRAEINTVAFGLYHGYRELHLAAERGRAGIAAALLEAKAITDCRTYLGGATPMHLAVKADEEVLRLFAQHKLDLDVPSRWGLTPLAWAYLRRDRSKVQLLRSLGAKKLAGLPYCCRRRRAGPDTDAPGIVSV